MISLEDLVDAGTCTIHEAPVTMVAGTPDARSPDGRDTLVLSAKDLRLGRAPSRYGDREEAGAVVTVAGDVIVSADAVRVCVDADLLLGPGLRLVRVHSAALDRQFLAGVLRAALSEADGKPVDLYQVSVPRIPPPEQRRYGRAFEQLIEFEDDWHRRRASTQRLLRVAVSGLAAGRLRPDGADT
ncbi:hypothetical protein [Nocardia sp. CC227C]|uniref:hypothetical protein n=1 Tax=Nocardia sp. CC227C TaxID=3044562 RepID=UPI00278C825A|nr:hypothetical protein [Nocardia sp. CC227C]